MPDPEVRKNPVEGLVETPNATHYAFLQQDSAGIIDLPTLVAALVQAGILR